MVIEHYMILVKVCSNHSKFSARRYPKNEPPYKVQLVLYGLVRGTYTTPAISHLPDTFTGSLVCAVLTHSGHLPSCVSGAEISLLTEAESSLRDVDPIPLLKNTSHNYRFLKNPPCLPEMFPNVLTLFRATAPPLECFPSFCSQ